MSGLLLDTCALIWIAQDAPLAAVARQAIRDAATQGELLVSPASAWEVGLLSRARGERPASLQLSPDPKTWFQALMARPGIRLAALTPDIVIDASHLPGDLHGDPGDRLIIATARQLGAAVVTRDRKILDYAAACFVEAVAC